MIKRLSVILLAVLILCSVTMTGCGEKPLVLNVYNWGEYISDGSEGSFDTIPEFEKWYEENYGVPVRVNYTTFASQKQ